MKDHWLLYVLLVIEQTENTENNLSDRIRLRVMCVFAFDFI